MNQDDCSVRVFLFKVEDPPNRKGAMEHRDFWASIIEQIEQFRRENRFGSVQLKVRNHKIVHFEMTPVIRGTLPKQDQHSKREGNGNL